MPKSAAKFNMTLFFLQGFIIFSIPRQVLHPPYSASSVLFLKFCLGKTNGKVKGKILVAFFFGSRNPEHRTKRQGRSQNFYFG